MTESRNFEEFYRSTQHRVVTFLYSITGDPGDAQEVAQEAYVRAWQRWSYVVDYGDPEAWVRKVGYRLAVNRWRKARNRLKAYRRHGPAPDVAPTDETTLALMTALRQLPDVQRLTVSLHYLLDLPVAEIARQTGVSDNTVKTRLARGRRRLSNLLGLDPSQEASRA